MDTQPQFSRIRNILWPIASFELKKFLPMVVMIFFIAANYNLLKIVKDSTVVPALGAEVLPYVKVWMMLPMAVLMTAFFSVLVRIFNENRAFYIILSVFLSYFILFVFVIYPNREFFDLNMIADFLVGILPQGGKGFASMVRSWYLGVFYTMCELWSTTVLFVLFWGFANRTTPLHEAKRFYALFGLAGNSSGIVAPIFFNWASTVSIFPKSYLKTNWEQTLGVVCLAVFASGAITTAIYYCLNRYIIDHSKVDQHSNGFAKKKKNQSSFFDSMKMLAKNPYVRNLTIVVLSYNIIINLTEIIWKDQIRQLYPSPSDYGLYFGKVMMVTGVMATLSDLLVCSNVIRKFGWACAAMVTPMILMLTSVGFFGFILFDSYFESFLVHLLGLSPLALTAFFGSMQNALARASKYSLFDATKEISFIPLDPESRIQSKAAIDGVCSRLGKSGGAVIYQGLFMTVGSLGACVPYVAAIVGGIMLLWINAVKQMGFKFNQLTKQREQEAQEALLPHDPVLEQDEAELPEVAPVPIAVTNGKSGALV
ncbi:MAG: NTP/NDP exchange transporter [Oligoflexales bacterium]|nr:NTP/NDP exchange transporter [Oligoflexales bacterium]